MESEASQFESSELLATFLVSSGLLTESWRLCNKANSSKPSQSFVVDQIGSIGLVAFTGVTLVSGSEPSYRNWIPLEGACNGIYNYMIRPNEGEEPVMVDAGFLQLFLDIFGSSTFKSQMEPILKCKSIVITGHSLGGTTASLAALWLLSYFKSTFSCQKIICITFGSPLLGNESLSNVISRERWGGNFCHVVSKHDIMPRLLFAPLAPFTFQLQSLLKFWHFSMLNSQFGQLVQNQLRDDEIFRFVLAHLEKVTHDDRGIGVYGGDVVGSKVFWPFGSYLFCTEDGALCFDNAKSVVRMMYLLLATTTSSPSLSIEDHLKYGDYVARISTEFLKSSSLTEGVLPESSSDAGTLLAVQSLGIASQEPIAGLSKDCVKMSRPIGRPPNQNVAHLAIKLSQINPYRAQIEWYKAICDECDDNLGYYDSFKRMTSRKHFTVNMHRHKLAQFWDHVIHMMETNQLPHDFSKLGKWVNASQFYKLLVEPLDIADYYRRGNHREKGHYLKHGRERRYEIFDRWWQERHSSGEEYERRNYASSTQDSSFWAKVEEARDWLDSVQKETDRMKAAWLWDKLDDFERYSRELINDKQVSKDVLLKNSSYSLWVEEWRVFKSQGQRFPMQLPECFNEEMVP
ncbi:hypothetical protein ACFE04_012493 [Oxalis oulophora]